jgi:hypothetical protein
MITPPAAKQPPTEEGLAASCPDLPNWAHSWCIESRDVVLGEEIVALFKPFLIHLLRRNLTRRIFRRHRDNLWTLGGEIIRSANLKPASRTCSAAALIREAVSGNCGPLIFGCIAEQEQQQQSFDSTCRLLHRFMASR